MYWVSNFMSGTWLLHDKGTTVSKAYKRIPHLSISLNYFLLKAKTVVIF